MRKKMVYALLACLVMSCTCACGNSNSAVSETNSTAQSSENEASSGSDEIAVESSNVSNTVASQTTEVTAPADAEAGDTVIFGQYEQDGDEASTEGIEWIVLDKQDGDLFLLSKYILDFRAYHEEFEDTTWEDCSIRSWLNDDFLNTAFSSEEQNQIKTTINLSGCKDENDEGDVEIEDKVFLLNDDEIEQYFPSEDERICSATEYAKSLDHAMVDEKQNSYWWLRSEYSSADLASDAIHSEGNFSDGCGITDESVGVRPAVWIHPEG